MDRVVHWHGHRLHQMKVQHRHGQKERQVLPNLVRAVIWVRHYRLNHVRNRFNCELCRIDSTTKRLLNSSKAFSGNSSPLNTYTSASDRHKPSVEESLNALTSEMVSSPQNNTSSIKPSYAKRSITNRCSDSRNSVCWIAFIFYYF